MKVLEVINLHKDFGGIKAVSGCDFSVDKSKITALIGPNGAGKTTVFNIITGYIKQDKGEILLEGDDITHLPPYLRAKRGIARTFQLLRLLPNMTVMENMLISMKHAEDDIFSSLFKRSHLKNLEKNLESRALEILKFVNLNSKANELAGNLSYGQQKLLEIARVIVQEPEIIMLDEPASGVNPTMLKKISGLLLELKKQGKTILFIEHDMDFVMDIADKIVVMDYGEEIAIGTPREIQKNKKVIDAYLGVTE